jgi:methylase of polypeptide subunit release factors
VQDGLVTSVEISNEPSLALFSGTDGLNHYKAFFVQIAESANKPTYIVTESLESQHEALKKLATIAGYQLTKTDTLAQLFTKIQLGFSGKRMELLFPISQFPSPSP